MIKTHNVTGLKYLCITKKDSWEKYTGSGVYWRRHLKVHGVNIRTELLYESADYDDFLKMCFFYSDLYDVAKSKEFANAIPEHGYETDRPGISNFELFWQGLSPEDKTTFLAHRNSKILEGFANMSEESRKQRGENISAGRILMYSKLSLEEKLKMMEKFHEGFANFHSDKNSPEFLAWTEKLSASAKIRVAAMTEEDREELGRRISVMRLSMSPEAKKLRGERVAEAYKTSVKRLQYNSRMAKDRVGEGNPGAKIVVWYGVRYTLSELRKYTKENNLVFAHVIRDLDSGSRADCYRDYEEKVYVYDVVTCPHCLASSSPDKQPSSFKRWHFDRCKQRKIDNGKIS